jgi:hypothetical protein
VSRWMSERTKRPHASAGQPTELLWLDEQGARWLANEATAWHEDPRPVFECLHECKPGRTRVWLSETLVHHLVCEPGLPLADESAVRAYAQQQFEHYFGSQAQRWQIELWQQGQQKGATALTRPELLATARPALQAARQVSPAWCAALDLAMVAHGPMLQGSAAAVVWVEGALMCWISLRRGQVHQLQHHRLKQPTMEALNHRLVALQQPGQTLVVLGFGLAAGGVEFSPRHQILGDLTAPLPRVLSQGSVTAVNSKSWPCVEFSAKPKQASAASWAFAGSGAFALAISLGHAFVSYPAASSAFFAAPVVALKSAHDVPKQNKPGAGQLLANAPRPPAPSAGSLTTLQPTALVKGMNDVHAQLEHPWEDILLAVEHYALVSSNGATEKRPVPATSPGLGSLNGMAAPGGVSTTGLAAQWLSLEHQAQSPELRVEGTGLDQAQALQMVDQWGRQTGWSQVLIGRFQASTDGSMTSRFDISARFDPRLLGAAVPLSAEPPQPSQASIPTITPKSRIELKGAP